MSPEPPTPRMRALIESPRYRGRVTYIQVHALTAVKMRGTGGGEVVLRSHRTKSQLPV